MIVYENMITQWYFFVFLIVIESEHQYNKKSLCKVFGESVSVLIVFV